MQSRVVRVCLLDILVGVRRAMYELSILLILYRIDNGRMYRLLE